ncbi:MAG TPA: histidine--tRNA ligase [Mogibacterium sp.]|nr:histidine--tRNA ligase [Mogibacterium sp.]
MSIKAVKGTKDVLPEDSYKWQYIENCWAEFCNRYGFKELRTPTFEYTELFSRGVGDTTDIVQKEMYTFEDLGRRSITLKPEGTSPAVRAFIENNQYALSQPTKYYYDTPCFRYEKPQAGRLREFHQFGVENFGTSSMLADAEVILLGHDFLVEMGIDNVDLHLSSVGCRKCRPAHRRALQDFLKPKYDDLCNTCKSRYESNPMRILDCKSEICQSLVKGAPMMIDFLCEECKADLNELMSLLDLSGVKYILNPSIVRGLDYYTKTAFEFVTTSIGAQGTICGGGRYDHLIEEIGGPDMPGVGFGLGKERLIMMMELVGHDFGGKSSPDLFIAWIGEKAKAYAIKLIYNLRKQGIRAELDTKERNLKGQMKYANRLNAKYTVVIGDDEVTTGELTLKDMKNSKQIKIRREDLANVI